MSYDLTSKMPDSTSRLRKRCFDLEFRLNSLEAKINNLALDNAALLCRRIEELERQVEYLCGKLRMTDKETGSCTK